MKAGQLDRLITIEQPVDVQGVAGGATETWSTFQQVWSQVLPLRGREYFAAQQVNAEVDATFRIRWIAGVTPKMRIDYGGVKYDIQHIAEIGRREGLDLLARVHSA